MPHDDDAYFQSNNEYIDLYGFHPTIEEHHIWGIREVEAYAYTEKVGTQAIHAMFGEPYCLILNYEPR